MGKVKINSFNARFTMAELMQLITNCELSYIDLDGDLQGSPIRIKALWDTGATNSFVAPSIAKKLGLVPLTEVEFENAKEKHDTVVYIANLQIMPEWNEILAVVEASNDDYDFIIGMDMIGRGLFSLWRHKNQIHLQYEVPYHPKPILPN